MAILMNGEPTNFFKMNRGLIQGCALSPQLFILVMDTLSRGIKSMKEVSAIKGCGISKNSRISHLMFVDDIMCVGEAKISEWEAFHKTFLKFSNVFGLNES